MTTRKSMKFADLLTLSKYFHIVNDTDLIMSSPLLGVHLLRSEEFFYHDAHPKILRVYFVLEEKLIKNFGCN